MNSILSRFRRIDADVDVVGQVNLNLIKPIWQQRKISLTYFSSFYVLVIFLNFRFSYCAVVRLGY